MLAAPWLFGAYIHPLDSPRELVWRSPLAKLRAMDAQAVPCRARGGRGQKFRSSLADLFVRRAAAANAEAAPAMVDCTNCAGSGLAEAA